VVREVNGRTNVVGRFANHPYRVVGISSSCDVPDMDAVRLHPCALHATSFAAGTYLREPRRRMRYAAHQASEGTYFDDSYAYGPWLKGGFKARLYRGVGNSAPGDVRTSWVLCGRISAQTTPPQMQTARIYAIFLSEQRWCKLLMRTYAFQRFACSQTL
jgi:hypothetical protein